MICIFSSSNDYSTTEVIKWLKYYDCNDVLRINYDDNNSPVWVNISQNDFNFKIDEITFNLSDISSIWYRKGEHWLCCKIENINFKGHNRFSEYLQKLLNKEKIKFSEFIHFTFESVIPCLGFSTKNNPNKLIVLNIAKEIGFNIPNYILTNDNKAVNVFADKNGQLISKPLSEVIYFFENEVTNYGYFSYTEIINRYDILNKNNFVSFYQTCIEKQFEVRTFYLDGECYSMAIFSQSNNATKLDFRKYSTIKPNRNIPFNLPVKIEEKVKQLFIKLELNTGSVDFIVNPENEFYFLEVNPVGQFGMVSQPCNYNLEKLVALKLMEYAKR
jgi:ATP-GRASP peptide maturase of grasp-with-spasm system